MRTLQPQVVAFFLLLGGCSSVHTLDQLQSFFADSRTTSVKVSVFVNQGVERGSVRVQEVIMGSVVRVKAEFAGFKPKGGYIFCIEPRTGSYENAMIYRGTLDGKNEVGDIEAYFYIPPFGQMAGRAKVFVYVPELGTGFTRLDIKSFVKTESDSNRDAVTRDLRNLGELAHWHYRRPAALGGGNNTFDASNRGIPWQIPAQLDTTEHGFYSVSSISPALVVLVGVGKIRGYAPDYLNANGLMGMVQVTMTVSPTVIIPTLDN